MVSILMATYNGGRFIEEQLQSIIQQSYNDWELIISDDGSSDNTLEIISSFSSYNNRIRIISNESGKRGACANFSFLFSFARMHAKGKYFMFADQDDIWHSDKVHKTVEYMLLTEGRHPASPVLIYGNLRLVDAEGLPLLGDLKLKSNLRLRNLLSFNYAYGCTMMLNKLLVDAIDHIPYSAENHDYWIALVASLYQSYYIEEKLLDYRQHSFNASGNVFGNNSWKNRVRRHMTETNKAVHVLSIRLNMFKCFNKKYISLLPVQEARMLDSYLAAFGSNRMVLLYNMVKYRMFRNGFLQTLSSFYMILFFYNRVLLKYKEYGDLVTCTEAF